MPTAAIRLPGVHRVENYMAAIAAVEGLVPDGNIRDFARTSNGAELSIVMGHGALRVSARAFEEEVRAVEKEIREFLGE